MKPSAGVIDQKPSRGECHERDFVACDTSATRGAGGRGEILADGDTGRICHNCVTDGIGRYFRRATTGKSMSEYTVTGRWQTPDGWEVFEKDIEAENEDVAVEHTYADFGSKHGLKRTQVEIEEVAQ
jgi:large subunit ribosomal protein LX